MFPEGALALLLSAARGDFGSAPAAPERTARGWGCGGGGLQKSEQGGGWQGGVDRKNPTGGPLGAGGEGVSPACWNFSPGNLLLHPPPSPSQKHNTTQQKNTSVFQGREGCSSKHGPHLPGPGANSGSSVRAPCSRRSPWRSPGSWP